MDISSMAFTNSAIFSVEAPAVVDLVVTGSAMVGGAVGDNDDAKVEGTAVVTMGMTAVKVVVNSLYLDRINVSNSFSISFNWSFSFQTKSISSSCPFWVSRTSAVCG